MKLFNQIFFAILSIGVLVGFILPFLISAQSSELTIAGIIVIIAMFYAVGNMVIRISNNGKGE